uniref:Uncharacterized protein n=1 Tax=Tetraselmis sp. GSL018 TaxID=582737 RepID=A0A061S3S5_9CHLO
MLCEEEPRAVGRVIAAHPHVLKDFFARRPGAMQIWFGQFSMAGIPGFRGGAKGLARFALARREEAWQHLVWEGKHPQAPVTVAAKPHYFCELSVSRTVRNLLLRCDGFLESHEMRECIEEGDFLVLDSEYFAKALLEACESGETLGRDAAQLMSSSALELPFWRLARKLLHLLDERDLLRVVNGLDRGRHEPKPEDRGRSRASVLPAELLAFAEQWERLDDALLFNALAANPRQLLALLRGQQQQEEEDEEEGNAEGGSCGLRGVEELCMGLRSPPACDAFAGSAEAASVRELLLESWAHLCVADLCARKGPEALSSLLRRSGLQCEAGDESRARLSEHARRKKRRRKSHERPSRRLEPEWALEGAGEGLPATWLVTLSGDPRWEGVKLRGSEAAEELRGRALARWCSASEGRGVAEAPRVRESRDPA